MRRPIQRLRPSFLVCGLLFAALLTASLTSAQTVPHATKVQGYLTDRSGGPPVPANGSFTMLFEIFDDAVGGLLIASVGPLAVTVTDGLYEVELPLSPADFDGATRFLQITVSGELLAPRVRLVSVPYSFRTTVADQLGIICTPGDVLTFDGASWVCSTPTGGTACVTGNIFSCYSGPEATTDVGACKYGTSVCQANGTLAACSGDVLPTPEVCDGVDNDCNGTVDDGSVCGCPDNDLDGFDDATCGGTDCDDSNNTVFPGATELCDNIDNDCDPSTADGNNEPWLGTACDGADTDLCLEGTFSCTTGAQACSDNTGDDVEICDGVDNDCDGTVDEGDVCTCPDADGDGFADASCGGADCNDSDPTIHPGLTELCDAIDNDCDANTADGSGEPWLGTACDGADTDLCQEGTFTCDLGSQTCSDNTGDDVEICDGVDNDCDDIVDEGGVCGCADNDGDGFTDASCGGDDCNDNDNSIFPGATEICDGIDNNCVDGVDEGGVCP